MLLRPNRAFDRRKLILPTPSRTYIPNFSVSGLTATPDLGQVLLTWNLADPDHICAAIEIWASKTNDLTTAVSYGETPAPATSFTHIVTQQGGSFFYWIRARDIAGVERSFFPADPNGGVQATWNNVPSVAGIGFNLIGGRIFPTVAGNALTVAIKTFSGNDPSPGEPVLVPFRDATSGRYSTVPIIQPTSIVLASGATIAASADTPFRLWLVGLNDNGLVRLGLIKCVDVNSFTVSPLNENLLLSAQLSVGASPGNSNVVYSTANLGPTSFRILGSLDWSKGLHTPGLWNLNADITRLNGIGMAKPGDVIQEYRNANANVILSGSIVVPWGSAQPLISDGMGATPGFFDVEITPTSTMNVLDYHAEMPVSHTVGACHIVLAVFRSTNTGAVVASAVKIQSANDLGVIVISARFGTGSDLAKRIYTLRWGANAAGTTTVNGVNNTSWLGGRLFTSTSIREIMV